MMNGRPLSIDWEAEHLPAILETWQLGSQAGNAIAQVLFGDYNPSGKLPMSFPRNVGQVPIYYNQFATGRPGPEDLVFWSHYTDVENSPLYPFGFGLSYSQFKYDDLQVSLTDAQNVQVKVAVTNTTDVDGEEVVQLYLRDRFASVTRPVKELKGFEKVSIEAGATKTITFNLTEKELGFYDADYNWVVEPGLFDVMVGTNSQEGLSGSFEIK